MNAPRVARTGYMRLGSSGFDNIRELLSEVKAQGMGAMEIFAMGMKAQGAYLCRTLSYTGAEFEVANVPITASFRQKYDRACEWWQLLFRVFQKADEFLNGKGIRWSQFWGAHMRFCKSSSCVPSPDARRLSTIVSLHSWRSRRC